MWLNPGDRFEYIADPPWEYTWIAMWGKRGTIQSYDWSSSSASVEFDHKKGQFFHVKEHEIFKLSVLDLMAEACPSGP